MRTITGTFRSQVRPGSPARSLRHEVGLADDDDVGRVPLDEIECARRPAGLEDHEPVVAELALEVLPRVGLVLRQQDCIGAHPR